MSTSRSTEVLRALSHYLGVAQSELFPRLELKRDLRLQPLDVVWFVTALQDSDAPSFPFERLEQVELVGDLVQLLTSWLEQRDRVLLAADEELFGAGPSSGSRRTAREVAGA